MDSSGEDDPQRLARDYPGWLVGPKRNGGFDACFFKTPDAIVLADATVAGLRRRLESFDAVFIETHDPKQATAAAMELQT